MCQGGQEHFAERSVLWDILACQLGWAVTTCEVAAWCLSHRAPILPWWVVLGVAAPL